MNENNKQVDDFLDSLEGITRATPGPYFFTRLQQRLNKEENSLLSKVGLWISRPAIAFSVIILVILLNVSVIFYETSPVERTDDTVDYYSMTSSGSLDYENP